MEPNYRFEPGQYPTDKQMTEARRISDANYKESIYGEHWKIYIDENDKHFLEFDIGHFCTKFVAGEITGEQYQTLKSDFSQYDKIWRTIDLNKVTPK